MQEENPANSNIFENQQEINKENDSLKEAPKTKRNLLMKILFLLLGFITLVLLYAYVISPIFFENRSEKSINISSDDPVTVVNGVVNYMNTYTDTPFRILDNGNYVKESQIRWIDEMMYEALGNGYYASIVIPWGNKKYSYEEIELPARDVVNKIADILVTAGFATDYNNSSVGENEEKFYDYTFAVSKGNTKCKVMLSGDAEYLEGNTDKPASLIVLVCSDEISSLDENSRQYTDAVVEYINKDGTVTIDKSTNLVVVSREQENYFKLNVYSQRSGFYCVGRWVNSIPSIIYCGQDSPMCSVVDENSVPKGIYENCYIDDYNLRFSNESNANTSLVGVWQANGSMGAGWADRYSFYEDRTFHFYPNEMVCESKEEELIGSWVLESDKLLLSVNSKVLISQACDEMGFNSNVYKETVTLDTPEEIIFDCEMKGLLEGDNHPSMFLDSVQYWKFSDNPNNY